MGCAANNPNISSAYLVDTSASSFKMIFCFEMCKRYVLLPLAGNRNNSNGSLNNVGSNGNYWSNGFSVRCLKDCNILHDSTTALDSFNVNSKQFVL